MPAEIPPMKCTNCPDLASYRTSSARGCSPITKILLPSVLGWGEEKNMGPWVICIGSRLTLWNRSSFSRRRRNHKVRGTNDDLVGVIESPAIVNQTPIGEIP